MRYQKLKEYINKRKRINQIHQLVIIKSILNNSGLASEQDLAKELLFSNESLVNDYSKIVRSTTNKILKKHDIVTYNKKTQEYRIKSIEFYSNKQIQNLIEICDTKIHSIKNSYLSA